MKERLLIVEDNQSNRKVLTYALKPYGYEIFIAITGEEALKMIDESEPDLILLDIRLPDISGYDICRQLKSREDKKHIPIIFTTAMSQEEHRVKGLELGAADFITKPFFPEEVILRVKNHLKLQRVEKKLKETIENQALLLDNIETMVWHLKDPETLGKVNNSFAAFFQRSKEELENTTLKKFLNPEEFTEWLQSNQQVFSTKTKAYEKLAKTNAFGEKKLLAVTKIPKLNPKGEVDYLICSAEDITERNKKEERIKYLTFHDSLTGLFNRGFYEEELLRLDGKRNLPLSIISCDVNNLKLANDVFGHQIGDQLLKEVAKILKEATRKEDIVARWGGDEFVVLLPNTTKEEAYDITDRINKLSKNETVELIPISIALGVATKEKGEEDIKQIFKRAEDRMYGNKAELKDNTKEDILNGFGMNFHGREYQDIQHSSEIEKNGKKMGAALNFNKEEQKRLDLLIKHHDIGKISVPKKILMKENVLTDEEWEQYKSHVEISYRIAKTVPTLITVAEEMLHHHERFDGKGFPGQLQGEAIPYLARVLAVLNFYDGLCSSMCYRLDRKQYFTNPLSKEEAVAELEKRSKTYFDPDIVKVFVEKVLP